MTSSHHASASPSSRIWTGSLTDLRHTFRLLWKSKGITATTLVTLALGIGATTAIFSSVYALMLKPLPFQEPAPLAAGHQPRPSRASSSK